MSPVVYLFILLNTSGSGTSAWATPYPSYGDCFAALKLTKIEVPAGAENEKAVIAWCGRKAFRGTADGTGWIEVEYVP